jgi:hypothetical protein
MSLHSPLARSWHDFDTPVPPLFATSAKLCATIITPPECGLRVPSMVCGIALVALVYATVRTAGASRSIALASTAFSAFSVSLVIWSRELKQYEAEAFLSVLVALLVFRMRRAAATGGRRRGGEVSLLMLICLVGPWLGYGSVFPISALLALLIFGRARGPARTRTRIIGIAGLIVVGATLGLFWLAGGAQITGNEALSRYFDRRFIEPTLPFHWLRSAADTVVWLSIAMTPFEWSPNVYSRPLLAVPLLAIGIVGLWTWPRRYRAQMAWWLVGPWILMLLAAILRLYPYGVARMMLPLLPPLVILAAAGLIRISRTVTRIMLQRGAAGIWIGLLLACAPALYAIDVPLHNSYWVNHDFPEVLHRLADLRQPGERVLVAPKAVPCVRFYAGSPHYITLAPVHAGTLPDPRVDYEVWYRDFLARTGDRWWLVRTSEPLNPPLARILRGTSFESEPANCAGAECRLGNARLDLMIRR